MRVWPARASCGYPYPRVFVPAFIFSEEGGLFMTQVKDLNKKRVCDLSDDRKTVYIQRGDCVTEVRAEKDGTLSVCCKKTPQAS